MSVTHRVVVSATTTCRRVSRFPGVGTSELDEPHGPHEPHELRMSKLHGPHERAA
ncbi:hypothetical protein ACWCV5_25170 [Streptomyces tubercidicus]